MNQKVERLLKNQGGDYILPFFWQHGETEEVLREYMKVIDESNIKAVCVESRPHPDFCGEKWWEDMDVILDEARKRNMQVWILDDSHFPTGFANGAMAGQPDELCRQSICCRMYDLEGKKSIHIEENEVLHPDEFQKTMIENHIMEKEVRVFEDDRLLSLFAVRLDKPEEGFCNKENRIDLKPFLKDNTLDWEVPEGLWKIYALHLSRNHGYHRSYINMMNRSSCKVLLDAVYEPHFEHYKADFGTTIAGFFSDEPELGNGHIYDVNDEFGKSVDYPWSAELEEKITEKLGDEAGLLLALLWETNGDKDVTAKVRYAYMDAVTRLVKEDFSKQMGGWCRNHGVKYIGHLIEDDNHHTRTGSSLGHYFRGLAGQDMSGIDDIGGQVFPQGEDISYNNGVFQHRNGEFYHYMLGKLGSSAAAIEPGKHGDSMCEIFGNYGWSEGVRLEKYLADHFMVRGINNYVPHAFSPKEFPDTDCPPHFYAHGHNPQYRHFGCLMAYMNRVCELISGGRHAAPAAVLYHAEGDWTGRHMTSDKVGHILADAQIEYDYIPQDVFANRDEYCTEIGAQILKVNTQEYTTVIVPYMQFVTGAFADAAAEMTEKGIKVLFVDAFPEGLCDTALEGVTTNPDSDRSRLSRLEKGAGTVKLEELAAVLAEQKIPEFILKPVNSRVRYCHYVHDDGTSIYLIVNEGTEVYRGSLCFSEDAKADLEGKTLYQYDAWENSILPVQNGEKELSLEIEPLKSRIYIFDASESEDVFKLLKKNDWSTQLREPGDFAGTWKRSICESIAYPDFEQEKEVTLPDTLAQEEPEFSGFVRYDNTFIAKEHEQMFLEITDAYEGVEVFVNDISLGIQIVPVYRYNLSEAIQAGENRIRIEVATTLERAMAKIPSQWGEPVEPTALSGITGEVKLWRKSKNK